MKKILITNTSQFGYHTDTYMYCKYLDKAKYEVHYIGFDIGYIKMALENVHIHNVPVYKNKIKRYWVYLNAINKLIRNEKFDIVFQVDRKLTLLVRLCNLNRNCILDIRTGDLRAANLMRGYYNYYILFTSLFYKHVSVISASLGALLHIPMTKTTIIPLGAEIQNVGDKSWNELQLFYIGALPSRNIYQTVEGLSIFIKRNPEITVNYDIVGNGTKVVINHLMHTIDELGLKDVITYHGRKNHSEITEIWKKANIGVVYIPMTQFYNCQPTTKLYECLLSGMPVIATNTLENKLAMTTVAGVLIDDNPEAFAKGLEEFWERRLTFNSQSIKDEYTQSTWQKIVQEYLEPYFETFS